MAIDIRQLHIGSHILVKGEVVRVLGVRRNRYDLLAMVQYTTKGVVFFGEWPSDSDMVEPIPITWELLRELAFEECDHGNSEHFYHGNMRLDWSNESRFWACDGVPVEFLHELENLYYLKYGVVLIKN